MRDYVDLFAGAGGWDVAASRLGLRTLGVEAWSSAVATRHAADLPTYAKSVLDCIPEHPFFDAHGLIASPPCQTVSVAGSGSGREEMDELLRVVREEQWWGTFSDERTALTLDPLRWVKRRLRVGQPFKTILLEQVPQALPVWKIYSEVLQKDGYSVWTGILDSSHYGVPQTRKRAVLIASLDLIVKKPERTHQTAISWGSVLGIDDNHHMESNYSGGKGRGEDGKWILGIRRSDEAAFTVTGKPHKLIGLGFKRRFTPSEIGVLQGFSAEHPWRGGLTDQYQQAGNAVPVQLAEAILRSVM